MLVDITPISETESFFEKHQDGVYFTKSLNPIHFIKEKVNDFLDRASNLLSTMEDKGAPVDVTGTLRDVCVYGVCDSPENLLQHDDYAPTLGGDRKFTVFLTPILRENEPPHGGWRWHRWGPYIGNQNPKEEYIVDEQDIDLVFVYYIVEHL